MGPTLLNLDRVENALTCQRLRCQPERQREVGWGGDKLGIVLVRELLAIYSTLWCWTLTAVCETNITSLNRKSLITSTVVRDILRSTSSSRNSVR